MKVELGNRGLSIHRWAQDNVSIGRQWLDRDAELYKRWAEFLAARKWADSMPYAPNRQLGLETAFRLMDEKKRFDVLSAARRRAYDAASERSAPVICDDSASVTEGVDFHVGEAMEVLKRLEGQSVHCVVTSPPYFDAIRDYQHAERVVHESELTIISAGWSQSLAKCVEFCVTTAHYGFAWEIPMPELEVLGQIVKSHGRDHDEHRSVAGQKI